MAGDRSNFLNKSIAPASAPPVDVVRGALSLSIVLRHGGTVEATLAYEMLGPDGGPVLIVAGGISAGRHAFASEQYPETGWWEQQRRTFDLSRFRVLSFDWIGADGTIDDPIDPSDQADGLAALMSAVGIGRAAAFIGASYGAMVGMHVASRYPQRIGALLAISAAAHSHPFASACRALQRQVLLLGKAAGTPDRGVALARSMAMLTYRTPHEFAERFTDLPHLDSGFVRVAAESYLEAQGARHCRRMTATAYHRLSESIDLHVIDPAAIRVPVTLVAVEDDALVPAADVRKLANALAGSRFELLRSHFGHDSFLKEDEAVARIIDEFLESLELDQ